MNITVTSPGYPQVNLILGPGQWASATYNLNLPTEVVLTTGSVKARFADLSLAIAPWYTAGVVHYNLDICSGSISSGAIVFGCNGTGTSTPAAPSSPACAGLQEPYLSECNFDVNQTGQANFSQSAINAAGSCNYGFCGCGDNVTCLDCSGTPFGNDTSCLCQPGYFATASGFASLVGGCFACPAGSYSNATGATSSVSCLLCAVGTYSVSVGLSSATLCTQCAAGTYSTTVGSSSSDVGCLLCAGGHFATALGLTSPGSCSQICPCGYFCPPGSTAPTPCPGGSYCPRNSSVPIPCNGGYVCPPTACNQTLCPCGFKCPVGAVVISNCSARYYCPNGSATQTVCPQVSSETVNYQLVFESYAFLTADLPSHVLIKLTQGKYCPRNNMCAPLACGPPSYQVCIGKTSCDTCSAGRYCPNITAALLCPSGYYCPAGSTVPTRCPVGTYCLIGSSVPTSCPCGTYCPAGSASRHICQAGTYCPANVTAPIQCSQSSLCLSGSCVQTLCPSGYVCQGSALANLCPAGSFCPAGTFNAGILCTPGYFCPVEGLSAAITCPPGSYTDEYGQITCNSCPVGTWVNGYGSNSSQYCVSSSNQPARRTLVSGRIAKQEDHLSAGKFQNSGPAHAVHSAGIFTHHGWHVEKDSRHGVALAVQLVAEEEAAAQVAKSVATMDGVRISTAVEMFNWHDTAGLKHGIVNHREDRRNSGTLRDLLDAKEYSITADSEVDAAENIAAVLELTPAALSEGGDQQAVWDKLALAAPEIVKEPSLKSSTDTTQGRVGLNSTSAAMYATGMTLSLLISALATRRFLRLK